MFSQSSQCFSAGVHSWEPSSNADPCRFEKARFDTRGETVESKRLGIAQLLSLHSAGLCQELVTWNEFHGGLNEHKWGVEPSNIGISP